MFCLMGHGADEDAVDNAGLTPYVLLILNHLTPFSKAIHLIRFMHFLERIILSNKYLLAVPLAIVCFGMIYSFRLVYDLFLT